MKGPCNTVGLLVLLVVLCTWSVPAAAARDLYIGDTVTLTLDGGYYTETQIRAAFDGFELVNLTEEAEGYEITVRTFESGIHEVVLGKDIMEFNVASTLDAYDRETVFPAEETEEGADLTVYLRAFLYLSIACMVISGIWLLAARLRKKKERLPEPFEALTEAVKAISPMDKGSLGKLNHVFKGYLHKVFGLNSMGMTSRELVEGLETLGLRADLVNRVNLWLEAGDRYKYQGDCQESSVFERMASEMMTLAETIETERQVAEA